MAAAGAEQHRSAAADALGEAHHEQCEINILMVGSLLPLTRDAAGHHPEAGWISLVPGESHLRHFPKAVCCLHLECQRGLLSTTGFTPLA